jgi:hypothetical protein
MLTVCPQCHRHIHDHESSCPFCRTRCSRNIQMLAAAAIGLAASSCSGNATYVTSDSASSSASASSASGDASTHDSANDASEYATSSYAPLYASVSSAPTSSIAPPYMAVSPDTGATDSADGDAADSADVCTNYCACNNICPPYMVAVPASADPGR